MAWILAIALLTLTTGASPRAGEPVVELYLPADGAAAGGVDGLVLVAGRVVDRAAQGFDVVLAVDISDSTEEPARPGARRGERGQTVLAAEVAGCEALLRTLNPSTTRVGVVTFAGDNQPSTPDAATQVPLTTDYERVRVGLRKVASNGPRGLTNMTAAVEVATNELLGASGAHSEKRDGARKVIVFLTDGQATLPVENGPRRNVTLALEQGERAAKSDVRIDTYGLGEEALVDPRVLEGLAHETNGAYTPVADATRLANAIARADFSGVAVLEIRNRTTDQPAAKVVRRPDGYFAALVPAREGKNEVEVRSDPEGVRTFELRFDPSAHVELPPELASR